MINIACLEKRCRQLNLENLPALSQLKKAYNKKDSKTVERIAGNIIDFLHDTYSITISKSELNMLERKSQQSNQINSTL